MTTEKKIIFTCGTKGGVGKSLFLRYIIEWFTGRDEKPKLIDIDDDAQTLKRYYPKARLINSAEKNALDEIIQDAIVTKEKYTIVDLKAGMSKRVLEWLESVDYQELKEEYNIDFIFIACFTTQQDSVNAFTVWAETLKEHVNYLFVLNNFMQGEFLKYINSKEENLSGFISYRNSKAIQNLLEKGAAHEIFLGKMDEDIQADLEEYSVRLTDFINEVQTCEDSVHMNPLLQKKKMRKYLRRVMKEIDKVKDVLLVQEPSNLP